MAFNHSRNFLKQYREGGLVKALKFDWEQTKKGPFLGGYYVGKIKGRKISEELFKQLNEDKPRYISKVLGAVPIYISTALIATLSAALYTVGVILPFVKRDSLYKYATA